MATNDLFGESGDLQEVQSGLGLDDGAGLRVVNARFLDELEVRLGPVRWL